MPNSRLCTESICSFRKLLNGRNRHTYRALAMQDMCSSVPLQVSDGILSIALILQCSERACGTSIDDRTHTAITLNGRLRTSLTISTFM
jgi:hypothetical protein